MSARIERKKRLFKGRAFSVYSYEIDLDGSVFERELLHRKDGVVIVPIMGDEVILLREYCAGSNSFILSLPGGKIDKGEDVETAAKRELAEETGYECEELIKLRFAYEHPSTSIRKSHVFAARGLRPVEPVDTGEIIEVVKLPFSEAIESVMKDFVSDVSTYGNLKLAESYLD